MSISKTNSWVFIFLIVVAWIIFVGLGIEAGGIVVNFVFHLINPDFVPNLYQKLDLTRLHSESETAFFAIFSFIVSISVLKAYLFFLVVMLMHRIDLAKPFTNFASKQILHIGYLTIGIGVLGIVASILADVLADHGFSTGNLERFWQDSGAFIFNGLVIHIIATIFKKGVDLQNEDDLTI